MKKLVRGSLVMIRAAILAFALVGAPAVAAPLFQAQPETAPAAAKFALRDMLWQCGAEGCIAAKGDSRPAIVCSVLAREIGTLRSFSFKGQALSAEELGKCNARAKAAAPEQVRTAARP
jgi:hypothetical protein